MPFFLFCHTFLFFRLRYCPTFESKKSGNIMKNRNFDNTHFKDGIRFICDYGYTPQRSIDELIANGASHEEANAIVEYIVQEIEDEIKRKKRKSKTVDGICIALLVAFVTYFFYAYPGGIKYLLIITVSLAIYKLIRRLLE